MSSNTLGRRFRRAARPLSAFGKNTEIGTTVTGLITKIAEEPKPKFDGAPDEIELDDDGQPVTQAVITLGTSAGPRTLYVSWRMEQAIGIALEDSGAEDFEIGATLAVTYTGPDLSYPKARLFTATYTPAPTGVGGSGNR
ncbi:hypothetical protein [Nocardia arthritidis]|uniref:Uncharacterized protein n=1 Tax=Nocardia arthritidis TaxID=228602 RepID=A0A6G9YKF8_9NOCA|nr:hypothetical protein [Nocardia arthritidis]QIS13640.1 hypothetical protein F5544_28975 [Nocardia arthritidis]